MIYLFDTNVVVALLRGNPMTVRERLRAAKEEGAMLAVSSVVLYELWYGVARSTRAEENAERLRVLLAGDLHVLTFDEDDAAVAGRTRAALEAAGASIGPYDVLIAGQGSPPRSDAGDRQRLGVRPRAKSALGGLDAAGMRWVLPR